MIRVEFEFGNEEDANNFEIPNWVGEEITNTAIGSDSKLMQLKQNEFIEILGKLI